MAMSIQPVAGAGDSGEETWEDGLMDWRSPVTPWVDPFGRT
jgi:hypothetical protein